MASWVLPGDAQDREILDASRRADPSAFDLLYRNYNAAVRTFCRRLLSGNATAAEDACQETMLKAYQALRRFRPGNRIWPWLSTIARNVCTDMHRDRQRLTVCAEPPVTEVSPGPEEIAATRARARVLRASLRRVEKRQRMYVYLRDAFGWSYEQIAEFDHTTVPAVRSVLHRGRSTLRDTVIDVARERHEWPLPAFLPVLWLRTRVRISQARDRAAAWVSRFDPSAALGVAVSSDLVAQATVAAALFAGVVGPLAPDAPARTPVAETSAAEEAPALPATSPAPAAGAPSGGGGTAGTEPQLGTTTRAGGVEVGVDATMRHERQGNRDVYHLGEAGAATASGEERTEEEDVLAAAGVSVVCPRPEERAAVSAALCPVMEPSN